MSSLTLKVREKSSQGGAMTGSHLPLGASTFLKELCFEIHMDADSNLDTNPENYVWRMAHKVAH